MRRLVLWAVILLILCIPVHALDITAPEVPSAGAAYMPDQTQSFGEALWEMVSNGVLSFRPDLREAFLSGLSVLAAVMALSVISAFPGRRTHAAELVGTVMVGCILIRTGNSMISLGAETISQLSEYGKLLLPVMAAALAAQGGITSAAALYTGTAIFDAALSGFLTKLLIPVIYLFLALAVGHAALGDPMLKKLRDGIRAGAVWCLKTVLYVYTGYISITGVVSGTTDATVLKAAKLTISGAVPVVGGILSDASEAVLIGAGTVKNAAGIYGMLAILAVWIGPFLRIAAHYLILKVLSTLCAVFGVKSVTELLEDFSAAMGLMLAATGAVCLMLIISTICFMKGAGL